MQPSSRISAQRGICDHVISNSAVQMATPANISAVIVMAEGTNRLIYIDRDDAVEVRKRVPILFFCSAEVITPSTIIAHHTK